MFTNQFSVKHNLRKLFLQRYERYLPTAFDESLSILEKMNQLIKAYGKLVDVVNAHTEHTGETMERGFEIIDDKMEKELKEFHDELVEQKRLYEDIRDKIHSDLLPDSVKQKLEEWLLNGTIEDLINETIFGDIRERLEFVENIFFPPEDEITFYIPRDFPNIQEAIDFVRKIRNGIDTNIVLQSGFKPSSGLRVDNFDMGYVILTSEDDVVEVADDFTGNFLHGMNAKVPTLSMLVDMKDRGGDGYRVEYSSSGRISPQCGVINAGGCGAYVRTSTVTAPYTKFTGANDRGLWVTRSGKASFPNSDFSDIKGGSAGVFVSRASICDLSNTKINNCGITGYALYVVRSVCTIISGEVKNARGSGILATAGSTVTASGVDVSNAGNIAVNVNLNSSLDMGNSPNLSRAGTSALTVKNNSRFSAINGDYQRAGGRLMEIIDGSTVSITGEANCRNQQGDGIYVKDSKAILPNVVISTVTGYALRAINSEVNIERSIIQSTNGRSIEAEHSSKINAQRCNIATTRGDNSNVPESGVGVRASYGSTVNLTLGRVRNSSGNDLSCRYGSMITAHQTLTSSSGGISPIIGDTNLSEFDNLTRWGVIFT